jgi:hypothetical protein
MASTSTFRKGSFIFPLLASLASPFVVMAQEESDSTEHRGHKRHDLGGTTVIGLTKAQEASRQSYNITAIDAKKLYNTTLDISHALDRVSGIRVR